MKTVNCLPDFEYFTVFLKNKNIIFKIRRSKVTDYAALSDVWLVQIYWKSRLIRTCVKLVGSSRNRNFRTRAKENGTLCKKTQTLFVQMSLSDVDSVRARTILSMQMAVLSLS